MEISLIGGGGSGPFPGCGDAQLIGLVRFRPCSESRWGADGGGTYGTMHGPPRVDASIGLVEQNNMEPMANRVMPTGDKPRMLTLPASRRGGGQIKWQSEVGSKWL